MIGKLTKQGRNEKWAVRGEGEKKITKVRKRTSEVVTKIETGGKRKT